MSESSDKQYSIKDIQNKLLGILLYFSEFCKEHNLGFVLAGGTCLGAIRHRGFIPWDDDLDVFMLREDYEKLVPLWNEFADTEKFALARSDEKINIHHDVTEIKDCNTTFINKHSVDLDINQGIMIDVIPLDAVAEGKAAGILQRLYAMLFSCYNFQRLPEHKSKAVYFASKIALGVVKSFKSRYKIWSFAEKKFTKYNGQGSNMVASFVESPAIMKQHFPIEWFINPATAEFEGHIMPVPKNYNQYLTISYGDYMQLPPKEEQINRHDIYFIDLDNCYLKYRGSKYYKQ